MNRTEFPPILAEEPPITLFGSIAAGGQPSTYCVGPVRRCRKCCGPKGGKSRCVTDSHVGLGITYVPAKVADARFHCATVEFKSAFPAFPASFASPSMTPSGAKSNSQNFDQKSSWPSYQPGWPPPLRSTQVSSAPKTGVTRSAPICTHLPFHETIAAAPTSPVGLDAYVAGTPAHTTALNTPAGVPAPPPRTGTPPQTTHANRRLAAHDASVSPGARGRRRSAPMTGRASD